MKTIIFVAAYIMIGVGVLAGVMKVKGVEPSKDEAIAIIWLWPSMIVAQEYVRAYGHSAERGSEVSR